MRSSGSSDITPSSPPAPTNPTARHCSRSALCSASRLEHDEESRMSAKHPIVAVTGSSGAGTTTVMRSFEHIFRREHIKAAVIEGDAFHRYDRSGMRAAMKEHEARGERAFSHFGPVANLLDELAASFKQYGETGRCRTRRYLHEAAEAARHSQDPGTFTDWTETEPDTDMLFYEGLHGAYRSEERRVGKEGRTRASL